MIGKPDDKPPANVDLKRPLTSKQDIPYYFLNYLLQPKNYMNVEGLKFIFKPYHILSLCDSVEEILMEQPNVLQGNKINVIQFAPLSRSSVTSTANTPI